MIEMEHVGYLTIVAMDEAAARAMARALGAPKLERLENVGPADAEKYKPGARVYHAFPVTKGGGN